MRRVTTNVSVIPSAKSGYSSISFLDGNAVLQINAFVVGCFYYYVFSCGRGQSKLTVTPRAEVGESYWWCSQISWGLFFQSVILWVSHTHICLSLWIGNGNCTDTALDMGEFTFAVIKEKVKELLQLLCKSIFTHSCSSTATFQPKCEELKPSFVT